MQIWPTDLLISIVTVKILLKYDIVVSANKYS